MKPNFFIVGAPRCGTTALSEYLGAHPDIFISTPKEPHYFAKDLGEKCRFSQTLEDYLSLFRDVNESYIALGEASVFYLYSSVALQEIKNFNPDAKLIAMIRNPVDLVYSLHAQWLYIKAEDQLNFENAWRLQASRRQGQNIPTDCSRCPEVLQYAEIAKLGSQIKKLLKVFPRSQVLVIRLDELASSPQKTYEKVLEFLNVTSDNRNSFHVSNNRKYTKFESTDDKLRNEIKNSFQEEIEKLSKLLNTDFSNW